MVKYGIWDELQKCWLTVEYTAENHYYAKELCDDLNWKIERKQRIMRDMKIPEPYTRYKVMPKEG